MLEGLLCSSYLRSEAWQRFDGSLAQSDSSQLDKISSGVWVTPVHRLLLAGDEPTRRQ
ncbi:hypothetical protein SBV1_2860002 [Verrucomicrobia bacterium]|nr:hypothetical protein SBV1_2860002 [Verrucomicrobiota bacterium]